MGLPGWVGSPRGGCQRPFRASWHGLWGEAKVRRGSFSTPWPRGRADCKRFAKPADPWVYRVTVEPILKPKQSQELDPEEQVEPNKGYAEFGKKVRKPEEKS